MDNLPEMAGEAARIESMQAQADLAPTDAIIRIGEYGEYIEFYGDTGTGQDILVDVLRSDGEVIDNRITLPEPTVDQLGEF